MKLGKLKRIIIINLRTLNRSITRLEKSSSLNEFVLSENTTLPKREGSVRNRIFGEIYFERNVQSTGKLQLM